MLCELCCWGDGCIREVLLSVQFLSDSEQPNALTETHKGVLAAIVLALRSFLKMDAANAIDGLGKPAECVCALVSIVMSCSWQAMTNCVSSTPETHLRESTGSAVSCTCAAADIA